MPIERVGEPEKLAHDLSGTLRIGVRSDADQKSWDVMNPEALKGHEGHHVQVSAHVYADKKANVMSVKMLKK